MEGECDEVPPPSAQVFRWRLLRFLSARTIGHSLPGGHCLLQPVADHADRVQGGEIPRELDSSAGSTPFVWSHYH